MSEADKLQKIMQERNLTAEHVEEYAKFEDECVHMGFTFKSILEARRRDVPMSPVEGCITEKLWSNYWVCPVCNTNVGIEDIRNNFCAKCGQRMKWNAEHNT